MEQNYQNRIEKIAQAIYLVSGHLKDKEPLKWELRRESIGLLSCVRSVNEVHDTEDVSLDIITKALSVCVNELISLLTLARVSELISNNNCLLIIEELQLFLAILQDPSSLVIERGGYILSHDFFASDPELQSHLSGKVSKGHIEDIKDKNTGLPKRASLVYRSESAVNKGMSLDNVKNGTEYAIKDKKLERQQRILTLLKAQSHLAIKDFTSVIPECSEKTIQRELSELVEKGKIKKEGERRWSTYSLV